MNVIITNGPAWAIGLPARVDGDLITISSHMGEPHWYYKGSFEWRLNTGLQSDRGNIPPQTLICGWCGNHRMGYVKDGVPCSCGGNSWMVCALGCLEHEQPADKA